MVELNYHSPVGEGDHGFGTWVEIDIEMENEIPVPFKHKIWPDGGNMHCCKSGWLLTVTTL